MNTNTTIGNMMMMGNTRTNDGDNGVLSLVICYAVFYCALFMGLRLVLRFTKRSTIVSFNFGAINTNPIEFDDGSKLLADAEKLLDFDLKNLDLSNDKITKERFSPLYQKNINFGLSDEVFNETWMRTWDRQYPAVKPGNLMEFDREIYKAITKVYSPMQFKKLFEKPYVNEQKKISIVSEFITDKLRDGGVVIIQEMNRKSIENLLYSLMWDFPRTKKLRSFESIGHHTITLIITVDMDACLVNFPNVNNETIAIEIKEDGPLKDLLIVGSHFTSKSDEKAHNNIGYESNYREFKNALSGCPRYVAGFDANHELDDTNDPNILPTSLKKRTKFQVQDKIAEVSARIDYINYRGRLLVPTWETVYNMVTGSNTPTRMPHDEMPMDHAVRILHLR